MGAAFRLETFSAARHAPPPQEDHISATEVEALLAKTRGAARAEGFEEGAAAAAAAYDADRKLLLERIAEAVEDARFNAEDARRAAMDALGPLLEALADAISPALARAGLGPEIAALVVDAARAGESGEIEIRAAPGQTQMATDALEAAGVTVRVVADPELGQLQARAVWRGGYDQIDLAPCIAKAKAAISAFFTQDERSGTDG